MSRRDAGTGDKQLKVAKPHAAPATNVIDLVAVLQRSLREAGGGKSNAHGSKSKKRATHKHAT